MRIPAPLQNGLLAASSLALFFAVSESLGRLFAPGDTHRSAAFAYDRDRVWRLVPGHDEVYDAKVGAERRPVQYRLRTNALGYRGPEIEREKPPGTVRVLALGDSVTFGSKVDDDAAFPAALERRLNAGGATPRYQVVNAGVPGYSSFQELHQLERALALEPDVVLVQFTLNDVTEPFKLLRRYGGQGGMYGVADVPRLHHLLMRHSATYRTLRELHARLRFGAGSAELRRRRAEELEVFSVTNLMREPEDPRIAEAWRETLRWLGAIFERCEAERIRCVLLSTPWMFQLLVERERNPPQRRLEAFAAERGIELVDLLPPLRERIHRDALAALGLERGPGLRELLASGRLTETGLRRLWYRYFVDYDHFSAAGHAFVAERLAPLVRAGQDAARKSSSSAASSSGRSPCTLCPAPSTTSTRTPG